MFRRRSEVNNRHTIQHTIPIPKHCTSTVPSPPHPYPHPYPPSLSPIPIPPGQDRVHAHKLRITEPQGGRGHNHQHDHHQHHTIAAPSPPHTTPCCHLSLLSVRKCITGNQHINIYNNIYHILFSLSKEIVAHFRGRQSALWANSTKYTICDLSRWEDDNSTEPSLNHH